MARAAEAARAALLLHLLLQGVWADFDATILPQNWIAVPDGGTLELSCSATGCDSGDIKFVWKVGDDASLGGTLSTQGSHSNLTLSPVGVQNAQVYVCLAYCGSDSRQSKTEVHVYSFSSDPLISNTHLEAGSPADLTCQLPTDVFPSERCTLTLMKNGQRVQSKTIEDDDDDPKLIHRTLIHRFFPTVEDDATEFSCLSEMSFDNEYVKMEPKKRQSRKTLSVSYAPQNMSISLYPSSTLREGDRLNLTCLARSNPPADITWPTLPSSSPRTLKDNCIVIESFQMSDSGVYTCEARNKMGRNNASIEVIVQGAPRNTHLTLFPNDTVKEGDTVRISCTSLSVPTPHIILKKRSDAGVSEITSEEGSYTILQAEEEHAGVYECEATNELGAQQTTATLVVQEQEPVKDFFVAVSVLTCISVVSLVAIIAAIYYSKQAKIQGSYSLGNTKNEMV